MKQPKGPYGPPRQATHREAEKSLPKFDRYKRISSYPILKWFLNPIWSPRRWEVTAVPINVEVTAPETVSVPRRIMERLIQEAEEIFVMDTCYCREVFKHKEEYVDIGCMAFGTGTRRIHPTHGRFVSKQEAEEHVRKAARAGLVADVAWVWVDPYTWGTRPFDQQLFVCFCDDKCFYRGSMQKRGPNLNKTYKKLPGSSVWVDSAKCDGCGACVESCFVAEMKLVHGVATPGKDCKACGRCAEVCPGAAIEIRFDDEEAIFHEFMSRIRARTSITSREQHGRTKGNDTP
jgi:ferredoxin